MIIIDSNYLGYVNRYGLSQGLTYLGNETEIIFGFMKHILQLAMHFKTKDFVFCWDSRESLRKKVFPTYKGSRRKDDRSEDEKIKDIIAFKQFDLLREKVLLDIGFKNVFIKSGYESDDIIAMIVMTNNSDHKIVVSSDNDLFQLLSFCSIYNIVKKSITTKTEFVRNFNIEPNMWVDVKALAGCSTDDVPGIDGVGTKTAIKYLINELKHGKIYDKIKSDEGKEIVERNLKLVKLPFDGLKQFLISKDVLYVDDFIAVCEQYGFLSFLKDDALGKWVKAFDMKA
jgi:DNA polymerase I